jgi:hypothetical protein
MGGRAAIVWVAALAVFGAAAAGAAPPVDFDEPLHARFSVGVTPSQLSKTRPRPVRLSIAGRYRTADGSHVPALSELELKLDRRFHLKLKGVPVCGNGSRDVRGKFLEGCDDAVIGRGTVEAEVAIPEEPLTTVEATLTIYNRGRRPGGADFVAWAYFPAPITGGLLVPFRVRRVDDGRYGLRARIEIPKLAGGYGSITAYSARIAKRFVSATCGDGKLQVGADATFADGTQLSMAAIHPCSTVEASP